MVNSVQYAIANLLNTVLQVTYIVIYHGYTNDKVPIYKIIIELYLK